MACAVAVVTLECDSMDVPEAIGELEICAILSEGDLAIPISINLNTICDQACSEYINMAYMYVLSSSFTSDDDFKQLNDFPLVFSAGTPINTTSCFNFTINDDELVEYDEAFSISSSPTGPVTIQPFSTKALTIISNDCE